MQRKISTCEHNVKRLRRCKTNISDHDILLTIQVPTLLELCVFKISQNVGAHLNASSLQHNSINNKIAQILLHYLDDRQLSDVLSATNSFLCTPAMCHLKELCVAKRNIDGLTDVDIMALLARHSLDSVTLSESDITHHTLEYMARSQHGLSYLDLSFCLRIEVFYSIFSFKNITHLNLERTCFKLTPTVAVNFIQLPKLRWLGLGKLKKHTASNPLSLQLLTCNVTSELIVLDLNETYWGLAHHHHLIHFKKLEHLDISNYPAATGDVDEMKFDEVIEHTVSKMSSLRSLDLSGCHFRQQEKIHKLKDLDLEFLGIVGQDDVFFVQDTDSLAKKVASHRKLEHILVVLSRYKDNVAVLELALKNLFTLHRNRIELGYDSAHIEPQLFESVLCTLERYPMGIQIQHIAAACLYTLNSRHDIKSLAEEPYPGYDNHVRRAIILLLISINIHTSSFDVLRNCMGMLSQFCSYQKDFMFFEIIHGLMHVLEEQCAVLDSSTVLLVEDSGRDRALKISTHTVRTINTSICQTSCSKKQKVGQMGLIESIVRVSRLAFYLFSQSPHQVEGLSFCELLIETWSTLWNITDEQAENCDTFVSERGLELYVDTYNICSQVMTEEHQVITSITTLTRNMLGLMGNIAEVPHIRPQLQNCDILHSFFVMRDYDNRQYNNDSDINEIRYSAAGILAHICSDGEEKWTVSNLTFHEALEGIQKAVDMWDINSKRSINYKSFHPILHILKVDCHYSCKLWAVWALTNLCQTKPKRFVPMLRRDGGVELLVKLSGEVNCPDNIQRLANHTLRAAYDPNIGSDIEEA